MAKSRIDYYFAPNSPWTYLGHGRIVEMAERHGAEVRVLPMNLGGVFSVSGGLPLAKRAKQRQDYRLVELRRFSEWLGLPLNPHPRYFPVAADDAARLIIATDLRLGPEAAMKISGATFASVWAQDRDIASAEVLAELLAESGLPADLLAEAKSDEVQSRYEHNTQSRD